MPIPLALIDAGLRGMVLALLLLLAGLLLRDRPRLPAAQAGMLLALGLVVQVISSSPVVERDVACAAQAPLVGVSVANAVAFWLFVQALFDDDFRWRPWHGAAWLFAFAVGTAHCALAWGGSEALRWAAHILLRAMPVVCTVLAVRAAVLHWSADLVEARRRLRSFVLVAGVLYTLAQVVARLSSTHGRFSDTVALLDVAGLLLMSGTVAWRLLCLTQTDLFPQSPPSSAAPDRGAPVRAVAAMPAVPAATEHASAAGLPEGLVDNDEATALAPPDAAEARLAAALQQVMTLERAYRGENLTVASLAARLGEPEYRLRRHINQRLGHRNFNAYINGMRLADVQAALADPAKQDWPVLKLALDAGFQSIGPFNRAFKAATGLTPTEYRKQHLADS